MRNSLPQSSTANDDDEPEAVVTADRADYHIVCCGPLWLGTYMTSGARAALWVCFFAWTAGVVYLAVTIAIANWAMCLKVKVVIKVAADEDAFAQVP
ncbi:hypothetical protein SPRG_17036 [Saprolegnia parasitica CBS 223.65]|uniref:Uncharacterized protein n=1 Tax=Saprolegnia parasitica (strain CBS 223.65) TaxID=695850 RepID=A0A067BGQ7_SAPPC|nr:hypothetical protein SPRG_17036 [Saprolegnia parasitica CBS 223.65]KDO17579.1 hypothetical protein SPRG_17036 [Saprolegnia parasitica CBS 223.65]|eukprot:XP_012211713.1 hypothetical protein SPRG_17036 [Saprolegnia parasitica CBS 223.65]